MNEWNRVIDESLIAKRTARGGTLSDVVAAGPVASLLLILLLSADIGFIALHVVDAVTHISGDPLLALDRDKGYPEVFQYLKWLWAFIVLVWVAVWRRSFRYVAWALVFAYFLVDDVLSLHEVFGSAVARRLTFAAPFGLRLQDMGELAVSVSAGLVLLLGVLVAYRRSSDAFKAMCQDLLVLVLLLAFFGVFCDMVHQMAPQGSTLKFSLGVVEDGGEMVAASFIVWYAFLVGVHTADSHPRLIRFVRAVVRA